MAEDWEYAGEEWKGKEEEKAREKEAKRARREARRGYGKFGRRAHAWFTRAVQHFLTTPTDKRPALLGDVDVAVLTADLFAADARSFAKWVPENEYLGNAFVTGRWEVDKPAIEAALPSMLRVLEDAARARVASTIVTLDEWLAADLAGKLPTGGAGGSARLPDALQVSLNDAAMVRDRHWPRPCGTCSESFKPGKGARVNCPKCVAAKREHIAKVRVERRSLREQRRDAR